MVGEIFFFLGYFLIMLYCMNIAIRTLHMKWYIGGAVFQLFSLAGNTVKPGNNEAKITSWVIYFVILAVTAIVMYRREKNNP